MPRATTKAELIAAANEQWDKMWKLIESLTDEELFEKKHFPWTGTTNVGAYCVSVTARHYDWATKKIKLYMKQKG